MDQNRNGDQNSSDNQASTGSQHDATHMLPAHRTEHAMTTIHQVPRAMAWWTQWRTPFLIIIFTTALVFTVAAVLSSSSLPGSALYSYKVRVSESAIAATKWTTSSSAAYTMQRFENRLNEMHTLSRDTASTSPETLAILALYVDGHTHDAINTVMTSRLSEAERINTLARFVHVTKAHEELADSTDEFSSIEDQLEDSRSSIDAVLETEIKNFASTTSNEEVNNFLGMHIQTVAQELSSVAQGSDAQRRAIARINDANDAISDGDIQRAIASILNAEEAIAVDRYLFASERGAIDGVPLPTVPEEG